MNFLRRSPKVIFIRRSLEIKFFIKFYKNFEIFWQNMAGFRNLLAQCATKNFFLAPCQRPVTLTSLKNPRPPTGIIDLTLTSAGHLCRPLSSIIDLTLKNFWMTLKKFWMTLKNFLFTPLAHLTLIKIFIKIFTTLEKF